jgi:peptide/nickel transport system substrate-binding protein
LSPGRAAALVGLLAAAPAAAGVRPRPGGELRVLLPAAPAELDPARAASPADLVLARALHATLLEVDAAGELRPALAERVTASPDGREVLVRLRAGLRFHDGSPVTAADVAESLARLLRHGSHAWIASAVEGADAVRGGRARSLAGARPLGELEVAVSLSRPEPDFLRALAAAPAAVVHVGPGGLSGAGPFRLGERTADAIRLLPFEGHHRGRPWCDGAVLAWPDPAAAARRLARGGADLLLRPEPVAGAAARDGPPLLLALAAVSPRLGAAAGPLRAAIAGVDRAELARLLRGPAIPLAALLPQLAAAAPVAAPPPGPLPSRLALVVAASLRPLAERLQVKLFDRGIRAAVEAVPDAALPARLAAGAHDVALLPVALASGAPRLALAQLAQALGGDPLAPVEADAAAAAARLEEALAAVPLAAAPLRAAARPAVQGLAFSPDGGLDLADLWFLPDRRGAR